MRILDIKMFEIHIFTPYEKSASQGVITRHITFPTYIRVHSDADPTRVRRWVQVDIRILGLGISVCYKWTRRRDKK